jgi:hypothetical protein
MKTVQRKILASHVCRFQKLQSKFRDHRSNLFFTLVFTHLLICFVSTTLLQGTQFLGPSSRRPLAHLFFSSSTLHLPLPWSPLVFQIHPPSPLHNHPTTRLLPNGALLLLLPQASTQHPIWNERKKPFRRVSTSKEIPTPRQVPCCYLHYRWLLDYRIQSMGSVIWKKVKPTWGLSILP